MGRLWVVGDKVQLNRPVIGIVVDVHDGGLTDVEVDGTSDYVCADEEYWSEVNDERDIPADE